MHCNLLPRMENIFKLFDRLALIAHYWLYFDGVANDLPHVFVLLAWKNQLIIRV